MAEADMAARLTGCRENFYRFLSRVYLLEVDVALFGAMRERRFPCGCGEAELEEGYRLLEAYLQNAGPDWEEELAADYAGVFLAAGAAQGLAAFPYESVYTGRQPLVGQEACAGVSALYAARGLRLDGGLFRVPGDHIGLELGYMAHLCREALMDGEPEGMLQSAGEQRDFLNAHLLNWYGGFCADLFKYAQTAFYKGIAKITAGFLKLEGGFSTAEGGRWDIA